MLKETTIKLLSALIFLFGINNVNAQYVSASSDMDIFDLRFSSSDPAAEVIWIDDWYGTVTAFAQDTDSGFDDDFNDLLGNNGFINAIASTAHVSSDATYDVLFGDLIGSDPNADINATTHSDLLLTEKYKQADGLAIADFDNYFVIIGGNPGDVVEVTFELDYNGNLKADADELGFFEIDLASVLAIEDIFGTVMAESFVFESQSGNNTSVDQDYIGTLAVTTQLFYEEEYWLFAGADAEVYGYTVPEPNILLLMISGLGFFFGKRDRFKKLASKKVAKLLMG